MRNTTQILFFLLIVTHAQAVWSSDACSARAIIAAADVEVSDGSTFRIESFFHSRDASAIRHIREDEQLIVVEGPQSWVQLDNKPELGSDFHKVFALGHQFHAFLLHFDETVTDIRHSDEVLFGNEMRQATSGDYPFGGVVHLIEGDSDARPAGLLFEFPDTDAISVSFGDWRDIDGADLPYQVLIDDGERVFDYRYSEIDITSRSPLWFFDAVKTPGIDQVDIYRLHRKLLAAHCLGDAELMSALSTTEMIVAGRGELQRFTNDAMRERFTGLFQSVDYSEYHDLVMPVIRVSTASDLGWIGVNVRAVGTDKDTGASFDDQWAWVMMVEKIDDVWVHSGNASNHLE